MTGGMPLLLSAVWLTTAGKHGLPQYLGGMLTVTFSGLIYNPLGAWLHDKVNSRRKMYITGFVGIIITTSCLAAMTAQYAGTTNRVGNGFGILFIYLYLAFQGCVSSFENFFRSYLSLVRTFCDTTMYLYVSEIFPTEIRPIGMGFSLFGQFAGKLPARGETSLAKIAMTATIILLQTAPTGFDNVGWKFYLVIICWSTFFIPGELNQLSQSVRIFLTHGLQ